MKCIKCGDKATVYFPVVDIDIKSDPYCDKCVEEERLKLMIAIYENK